MKLRVISFLLLVVFLVPSALTGCLAAYATEDAGVSYSYIEEIQAVSVAADALKLSGVNAVSMGNHGANQNRVVSVSSGMYLGVMLEPTDGYTNEEVQATIIRVNADGTADLIYKDFIADYGATTVTIMADKNEDIWMYSGWENGNYLFFKVWQYDVSENKTTAFETVQAIKGSDGAYGYSTAVIDPENEKIFAMAPGGGVPGWFCWCEFDMVTKEWLPYKTVQTPYRYCYNYAYPDGDGGILIVGERDIQNRSVESNISKLLVVDAMSQLRSRKIDADYMWDELYLIHIPDPAIESLVEVELEGATYDVENGIYPNIKNNGYGDTFLDSNGNLHTLYTTDDDGVAGVYMNHKIYDVSEGLKEIYSNRITFLYGDNTTYGARMFEDLEGNVYILAAPHHARSQVEVWKATDDLNTKYKLVHNEFLQGVGNRENGGMILANNRNNSTPSNTASFILSLGTWYAFTIDLTPFADR